MSENHVRMNLIELVRKIIDAQGTEEELDNMLEELEKSVPHPNVNDLIFFPRNGKELTPEEVVDIALSYKPFQL